MKHQIVGFTIGILLVIIGVAEFIPALVDMSDDHMNSAAFVECALVSLFFGGALILSNYAHDNNLDLRQTFMLTVLSWLAMSVFAAFPFYFSDLDLSFTDAFFESVSGVTTTGSTVLSGLDGMSRGILLWRSITQWIGGIGIIAFAIVILPFLRIGGMQLFRTESSDKSEKVMPRTVDLVASLLKVYAILTAACAATFFVLGMNIFDAINHALTTIPTGGYSTHDASFGFFKEPALHYAGAFFMLCGGIPFVLYIKFFFQGKFEFFKDEQFRSLLVMLVCFFVVLTSWLWLNSAYSVEESLRYVVFNVISIITTTGFATTDYTLWGGFAATFIFFLTFLGACSGSTAGGMKVMRLVIALKLAQRQIKTLLFPHGVFTLHYQGRPIDSNMAIAVLGFLGVFAISAAVLAIALSLLGLDFETAISASATALANVGPGIGNIIGPSGNFASLPDTAKWLLCAAMLFGRLEMMTVLVLFRSEYWRR